MTSLSKYQNLKQCIPKGGRAKSQSHTQTPTTITSRRGNGEVSQTLTHPSPFARNIQHLLLSTFSPPVSLQQTQRVALSVSVSRSSFFFSPERTRQPSYQDFCLVVLSFSHSLILEGKRGKGNFVNSKRTSGDCETNRYKHGFVAKGSGLEKQQHSTSQQPKKEDRQPPEFGLVCFFVCNSQLEQSWTTANKKWQK